MYAKYIKQEYTDLNGTGRTQAFYKMELRHMDFGRFVRQCAREGHTEEGTILGVLSLVSDKLALCMAEGFSVKIDGIGTFSAKLGVRADQQQDSFEPGESSRNAGTIQVSGVAYRADNALVENTRDKCTLKRGGVSRIRKPSSTLEERICMARDYLSRHMFMRVPDYMELTGLARTAATVELRKIVLDPSSGITYRGEKSQKMYVLRVPATGR